MGHVLNACNNAVNKQDKAPHIEVFQAYRAANAFSLVAVKYKTSIKSYNVLKRD